MRIGDKVLMTDDAIENYGEEYRDKEFTICAISWRYMPAKEFYDKNMPHGYHPGYDEGVGDSELYDFEELEFSLYDWEIQ